MKSETFPAKLKRARERAGLTQAKAATVLGVACTSLQSWEQGTRTPPKDLQVSMIGRLTERQNQTK